MPAETEPSAAVDQEKVAAFVQGALHEEGNNPSHSLVRLDPKAKPASGINLRLNEYQIVLLRFVATHDDRSQQQTAKRILIPALEAKAREITDNQTTK